MRCPECDGAGIIQETVYTDWGVEVEYVFCDCEAGIDELEEENRRLRERYRDGLFGRRG